MRAAFTGSAPLTFMDYIDGETGRTLTAAPGGVYEVVPVGAHPLPEVPPGFVPVEEKAAEDVEAAAGPDAGEDGE